jgi:hypothetical protein
MIFEFIKKKKALVAMEMKLMEEKLLLRINAITCLRRLQLQRGIVKVNKMKSNS